MAWTALPPGATGKPNGQASNDEQTAHREEKEQSTWRQLAQDGSDDKMPAEAGLGCARAFLSIFSMGGVA